MIWAYYVTTISDLIWQPFSERGLQLASNALEDCPFRVIFSISKVGTLQVTNDAFQWLFA